jgi:hypothetical protein
MEDGTVSPIVPAIFIGTGGEGMDKRHRRSGGDRAGGSQPGATSVVGEVLESTVEGSVHNGS